MPRDPRPDPTNAARQQRHKARKRAIAAAMAVPDGPDGAPDPAAGQAAAERLDQMDRDGIKTAIRKLHKLDRLACAEAARATMAEKIQGAAGRIADKLIELGMQGDVAALLACARSVLPPAKDERRVR